MSAAVTGLTFDTGALIALERRKQRIVEVLLDARKHRQLVTVPGVVVAEWWRGRTDRREQILAGVKVELADLPLLKLAGEALAHVPGATAIDSLVMASAALRGDTVYTSDYDDLAALRSFFPNVRVLKV